MMDMQLIEPKADELAGDCDIDTRLLYSIAVSIKRIADFVDKVAEEMEKEEAKWKK